MSEKKKIEIVNKGNFPSVRFNLDAGEEIIIQKGSMVQMTPEIRLSGKANGGIMKGLFKKMMTGETFFISQVRAEEDNQSILISPHGFGDIKMINVKEDEEWGLSSGAFLACTTGVSYSPGFQNVGKALFANNGGFVINKVTGRGRLFIESFGSLVITELEEGESMIVDNNHLVAWETKMESKVKVASGVFGYTTGEGIAIQMNGPGTFISQSRNVEEFSATLGNQVQNNDNSNTGTSG